MLRLRARSELLLKGDETPQTAIRLRRPSARRTCGARRKQLVVTPTVADELPGNVRMSEGRYWEDVLAYEMQKANQHYDSETFRRIIANTKEAAGEWMRRELRGEGWSAAMGGIAHMARTDSHRRDERQAILALAQTRGRAS